MTDQALIEAVAKHLGWTRLAWDSHYECWEGIPPEGLPKRTGGMTMLARSLPSWLTSRDATQEVVDTLDDLQQYRYIMMLLCENFDHGTPAEFFDYERKGMLADIFKLVEIPARQRMEAYLKVMESEEKG